MLRPSMGGTLLTIDQPSETKGQLPHKRYRGMSRFFGTASVCLQRLRRQSHSNWKRLHPSGLVACRRVTSTSLLASKLSWPVTVKSYSLSNNIPI